jgi:hypothetical protein
MLNQPWTIDNPPDVIRNKQKPAIEAGVAAANSCLSRGQDLESCIFAAIAAANAYEKNNIVKKAVRPAKVVKPLPLHVTALYEAANLKKQKALAKAQLEQKQLQALKESISAQVQEELQQEIKDQTATSIVDMKVQGEDVILVQKNGKTMKRRLADYTINSHVTVAGGGQEPTFTNPDGSIALGGIPAGSTFDNVPVTEVFNQLLYPFTVALAASPSLVEIGLTLTSINLAWSVSEASSTLSLNQGIGDVTGLTSYEYTTPTTSNTTFTITAINGTMTRTANASVQFKNRVITGVTSDLVPTELELLAAGGVLSDSFVRSVNYDCSGGRRFYIAYPVRLGVMPSAKVNNLAWNDWTQTTVNHTNASGYSESYVVLVSNNLLYGAAVPVAWGA